MGGGGASAAVARDHTRELHAQKVAEQRTCVVKGLGKHVATSAVCAFMEPAGSVQEVQRVRKTAFVTFTTARQAAWAVERLNNQPLQGLPLQVFLLGGPGWAGPSATADAGGGAVGGDAGRGNAGGDDASGDGAAGAAAHTVSVGPVPGAAFPAAANRADAPPEDSAQSPPSRAGFTGLYLVRLLRLWRQKRDSADALALLRVVTAPRSRQAKEVCEAMAVSQALFDFGAARKLDLMRRRALVFVPGDGNRPNAAAALALHVPDSWRFYSIDPVLRKFDAATLGPAAARLHVAPTMLEEFPVPQQLCACTARARVRVCVCACVQTRTLWLQRAYVRACTNQCIHGAGARYSEGCDTYMCTCAYVCVCACVRMLPGTRVRRI